MKQIPERQVNNLYLSEHGGLNDSSSLDDSLDQILQYNARLKEIVAELLIKNQILRWAIRAGEEPDGQIRHRA